MLVYKRGHQFEERLDETGEKRLVTVYGKTLEFPSDYPTIFMVRDIEWHLWGERLKERFIHRN